LIFTRRRHAAYFAERAPLLRARCCAPLMPRMPQAMPRYAMFFVFAASASDAATRAMRRHAARHAERYAAAFRSPLLTPLL